MKKMIVLSLAILMLTAGRGLAETTAELFSSANDKYEQADWSGAIAGYEKILSSGKKSPNIYYNLAGAYFKSGNLGKAILNYERALALDPRDADIRANYRFARSDIKAKVVPEKGVWNWTPLRVYERTLSVDQMTIVASVSMIVILVLLAIGVTGRMVTRYHRTILICFSIILVFNVFLAWHKAVNERTSAIVMVPAVEALYGPFDSATKFFTLNEGMKVNIINSKDGWVRARRSDGKSAWIKDSAVERVLKK
ncbi:MAG: tetratricopeptide repeat protein [Candidatus Omnitrophica bacterium]|nr:tetratricopeptide repeat protein [Candidatus Omnitrophota bacterium]MDD5487516.1 tetratricopeptide repeat protein [Candidatus Omnitrophota bacterium]